MISDDNLVSFEVIVKETDLYIRAEKDLSAEALAAVNEYRGQLENYILQNPLFLHSLEPLPVEEAAPLIVRLMAEAGKAAGVGPMAAVAGTIAELVGMKLLDQSAEVIVENGGDIFIKTRKKRLVGIYAGDSPFTGKVAVEIGPSKRPLGICTSSGTVGHSLSLGLADAAIVVSKSAALADAAATAVGNMVKSQQDIPVALERGKAIKGVDGLLVIAGDRMGAWGDIRLAEI